MGKYRRALDGSRFVAASWREEFRKKFVSCGHCLVGTVARFCFRNQFGSVAGAVHGDDNFVPGISGEVLKVEGVIQEKGGKFENHSVSQHHTARIFQVATHSLSNSFIVIFG